MTEKTDNTKPYNNVAVTVKELEEILKHYRETKKEPDSVIKKPLFQYLDVGQLTATVLAVTGVLFNNAMIIWCFPLWIVSNLLCLKYHCQTKLYGLAVRDVIFIGLAIAGWIQWSMK